MRSAQILWVRLQLHDLHNSFSELCAETIQKAHFYMQES